MEFTKISPAILSAFIAYQRKEDLIQKKYKLLQDVLSANKCTGASILFLGFDPWIMGDYYDTEIFVSLITDEVAKYLDDYGVIYTRIHEDDLRDAIPCDIVVAADELLTYSELDQNPKELIELLSELADELFVTTVRDYKNLSLKSRDFSDPTVIKNDNGFAVFLEYHDYKYKVKNQWHSHIYANGTDINDTYGPFARQPIFFKQLAKFAFDSGATNFMVHRDLMFKSLIKKSYEHIISVSF